MLGHSSLQMIFTRYYAWIPKKTRNDGSAFMKFAEEDFESNNPDDNENVFELFDRNGTKTSHPKKKSYSNLL